MNYSYPAGTHSKASLGDTHSVLPAPYSWLLLPAPAPGAPLPSTVGAQAYPTKRCRTRLVEPRVQFDRWRRIFEQCKENRKQKTELK